MTEGNIAIEKFAQTTKAAAAKKNCRGINFNNFRHIYSTYSDDLCSPCDCLLLILIKIYLMFS